ncbi:MAG TPA: GGDEF domain-containing protein [Solirubrobacteraceae bacterium]|nr:GGDEF domain-containing protein [Solirubrobacteraceae bacterium]
MASTRPDEAHLISRHTRFLAAIAALAVAAILVVAAVFALTESERTDLESDTQVATQLWVNAGQLSDAARDQESAIDNYIIRGGADSLTDFDQATANEASISQVMTAAAVGLSDVDGAITAVRNASAAWQAAFARPVVAAIQAGGGTRLQPFTSGPGNDHETVNAALLVLDSQLQSLDAANLERARVLTLTRTGATVIGVALLSLGALLAIWLIRRYGRALERDAMHAGVLNRFTEVTSFASDDTAVAASSLEALAMLVHPDAAVTHVLNRSKDRAVPEAIMGEAIANVLALDALSACVGLVRGSMYVTEDAQAALSVHCPVYPAVRGTVVCVPMNSGESIGAVHLYWERPFALPLQLRSSVMRIVEHAALAIGNRRLLAALRGQASTDPRTSLANTRAFDLAVEAALNARTENESLSVLMLDVDHFKEFNDQHGHPAGDQALRAFADVLRSCMRDGDLAARYGGEEFAVLLPGVDGQGASIVAERIRARTESTIIALAPGITARLTVSVGVSSAPVQGTTRLDLLQAADGALYQAKAAGRNRIQGAGEPGPTPDPAAPPSPRRPRERAAS